MLIGRALAVAVLLAGVVSTDSAFGQIPDEQVFSFSPDPPIAGQDFLMTLDTTPCSHGLLVPSGFMDRIISVSNGRIEVTVPYYPVLLCTPAHQEQHVVELSISALAQGNYDQVVYGQDQNHPDDPGARRPLLVTTISVVAHPVSEPLVVPATSSWWLLMLAGICLALGALRLRVGT